MIDVVGCSKWSVVQKGSRINSFFSLLCSILTVCNHRDAELSLFLGTIWPPIRVLGCILEPRVDGIDRGWGPGRGRFWWTV